MDRDAVHGFLRDMLLARAFEEAAAAQYAQGNIAGFLHLYPGEEAVAVGVIHAAEPADYIVSTYREHVHAIVRGTPPRQVMAELFGRRDGICRGMGGSMHLFDRARRFMGGYAVVGETYPVAIGIGYAIVMRDLPEVAICFFGDGAVNQGTFHESLNMAALWHLPVLFVCENNHYQIGTEIHRHSAVPEVYKRAAAYNIPGERVDGMDVFAVHEATSRTLREIRSGGGPRLLECETYRLRGHSMADPGSYRPHDAYWQLRQAIASDDPIILLEHDLLYFSKGAVDVEAAPLPMHRAVVRRPGRDLTLVGYSRTVDLCLRAAEQLFGQGVDAEVIDLRSLSPIDWETCVISLEKTHRLIVVEEDCQFAGAGAEVAATLSSRCFFSLDAPIQRVAALDIPTPFNGALEAASIPGIEDVVNAAQQICLVTGQGVKP